MNISHFKILIVVAEQGSLSAAALQLGVSQSCVSRAIASLEEDLGVSLLARGRFGAYPTAVGERVLTHARVLMKTYGEIEAEAHRENNLYGGRVRIASFRSVLTHIWHSPAVFAFLELLQGKRLFL